MPASAAQKLTLRSSSPPLTVTGIRGQVAPSPTGGFGGWQTISRPHRKSLTEWQGIDPLELTFSVIFDGGPDLSSVESDCLTLEQMAQPDGTTPPPTVTVTGAVPHSDLVWVIDALAFDPAPAYSKSGYRIRQEATVTLKEYVSADLVKSAAETARGKVTTAKSYIVKKGDTLLSIAAAQLGDFTRWTDIAALNGIRDPNRITVGQRLRLP